jgi:hypothetical protein
MSIFNLFNFNNQTSVDDALQNYQNALSDAFGKMKNKRIHDLDKQALEEILSNLKSLEEALLTTKQSYGSFVNDNYKTQPPFPTTPKELESDWVCYDNLIIICNNFFTEAEGDKFLRYWGVDFHRKTNFIHLAKGNNEFADYITLFKDEINDSDSEASFSLKKGYQKLINWMEANV